MGRYDKIAIWHNNGWHQPKEIQVYHLGKFESFGKNDSDNQRTINVYDVKGNKLRATLNKHVVNIPGESFVRGPFNLYPNGNSTAGYGNCAMNTGGATNFTWVFYASAMRKTEYGDKNIFVCSTPYGSYIRVVWLASGHIFVEAHYSDSANYFQLTTKNAVGENQWVTLNIRQEKGSYTLGIWFNGEYTSGTNYQAFSVINLTNEVGAWGIDFKDIITVQGCGYGVGAEANFNVSQQWWKTDKHSDIYHIDTSSTKEEWV